MVPIITISMIIEVNRRLEEQSAPYRVHMTDACGSQSFRVEPEPDDPSLPLTAPDSVYARIQSYFESERIPIEFSADRHAFWVSRG